MHGKFLKKTLQKEGINTDAIVEDRVILQRWHLWKSVKMENEIFPFARKPGADTQLKKRTGSDVNFRM